MSLLLDYLTPESLGLDAEKFPSFRDIQLEAIEKACFSDKRFVGLCCPTGTGKELVGMGVSRYSAKRSVILTHTRSLQDQYLDSHSNFGLVDIRGKDNYHCLGLESGSCRDGAESNCGFQRGHGCSYEIQKARAMAADTVISNYAFWINVNDRGSGLGDVDMDLETGEITGGVEQLILDEGHEAGRALENYLGFRLYEKEISRWIDPLTQGDDLGEWAAQARLIEEDLKAEIRTLRMEVQHVKGQRSKIVKLLETLKHLRALYDKIFRLAGSTAEDWVCEKQEGTRWGRIWEFNVISPGRYAEKYIYCGVPKVIFMSATLRPRNILGVRRDDMDFFEWAPIFPPQRNLKYFYPAIKDGKPLRISRSSSDSDLKLWVAHNDSILDQFLDRRCVVITTSYAYQKFFMENSKHASHMVGNTQDPDSDSAREVFEKFIVTPPPIVLCSPSFGTGWNFSKKRGELLLIPKLPLRPPPSASKLIAARMERDRQWSNGETMQDIAQWAGRLMREDQDRSTVIISDGSWAWFAPRSAHLAPRGFVQSVRRVNGIKPMEKL